MTQDWKKKTPLETAVSRSIPTGHGCTYNCPFTDPDHSQSVSNVGDQKPMTKFIYVGRNPV